jgi:transglutaminase-like putative cysteine protease
MALALLPHARNLPLWILVGVFGAASLRIGLALAGRDVPPPYVRWSFVALAACLLFLQFHTFNGITAGTAFLALTSGLKLLETRSTRDFSFLLFTIYFSCLAALLISDSIAAFAYAIGVCWVANATFMRLTRTQPGPDWRAGFGASARLLLQAAPLALVLWLFFPRFAAPLWQITDTGPGAVSGLGDTLSPGDISDLALSDDVAFRARFAGATPPPRLRYWRGLVLHDFDGHTWRRSASLPPGMPRPEAAGAAYRYTLELEPSAHAWVFALDWPVLPESSDLLITADATLELRTPASSRAAIQLTSYPGAQFPAPPSTADLAADTRLPQGRNPRTRELAVRLRRDHPDDADLVRSVLDMLHTQEFYYTLTPPPLGGDAVDEFLFATKAGFCGHYASAFAVLMRAAGLPAHVVTGYYGGAFNPYAGDWILRQSDAHAWTEIWIAGRGWIRVDPTSAIDPLRIDQRLRDAVAAETSGVVLGAHLPWLADLRLRVDALRELWRGRILHYDPEAQNALLRHLGIPAPDVEKLVLVLAAGLAAMLGWLTWQLRLEIGTGPGDAVTLAYARLCGKLESTGLRRAPHEGAEAFGARVARARPDLAAAVTELIARYSRLRFGAGASAAEAKAFSRAVRAFRPRSRAVRPRDSRGSS